MRAGILAFFVCLCIVDEAKAQFTYGTTGLLNMPTAEMQRDKTFMVGASFLDHHTTPARWFYNTYNYYINITIFPWMEVAYTCTLHKALKNDPYFSWVPSTYGKFINQDRNFSLRLRLWKEGWWKKWTPQLVLGVNDPTTASWNGGASSLNSDNNGYYSRFYLAAMKHWSFTGVGELGIHAAYLYNKRKDYHFNGPAIGSNFCFELPSTSFINKVLNGMNLMAEYDSKSINVGMSYSVWKDYINVVSELNRCKYLSLGIYFKIHLK